jgi:nucleoside-diphosphate-sugar epimerase
MECSLRALVGRTCLNPFPSMNRMLVVGAGFLGAELIRQEKTKGHEVIGVSLAGGEGEIACDVSDAEAVAKLPDAEMIVHCAASGRGGEDAYRKVYLEGCRNLIARFPRARLIFTSSSSVYAQMNGELVNEDSETIPDRETGRILLETERLVLAAGGAVARLAGIYGPGRSVLLRKFLADEAVIEEAGERLINQIHRDDAAAALSHLFALDVFPRGEIFNVVDSTALTQLELYQGLANHFRKALPPTGPRDMDRKRGWTHKRVDNSKLCATGWRPAYPSFLDAVDDL